MSTDGQAQPSHGAPPADELPFVVPCRVLGHGAPLRWLKAGWGDIRRAPGLTLVFGLVTMATSLLVSWLAWSLGRFALLAVLLSVASRNASSLKGI